MEYLTNAAILMWLGSSLGSAFIATFAVDAMGRLAGISSLGESGGITVIATGDVKYTDLTFFESCVEQTGFFPFLTIFGPFAIPVSVVYLGASVIGFLQHFLTPKN